MKRIKIVYKHAFRDQSKEDDYTDLSQNLFFLELLNHQIHKYFMRVKAKQSRTNGEGSMNAYIKSTANSGTKSKMNGQIYSSNNEEHKYIDEDTQIVDLIKENSDAFEYMIPGYLIRISRIDGISKMSHDDRYYSVMIFQRYIRRRRLSKKEKETDKNDRYVNSYGVLPAANLQERQIICNSFSQFVRNNLVVDSKTFVQSAMTPSTRKKILSETKNRRLSLNDKKTNVLLQSYIQSKEIKRYRNIKKNPLRISNHIRIAESPFDKNGEIGPESIHLQMQLSNNIGPLDSGETGSIDSGGTDNIYPEFYYESGIGSGMFDDVLDKDLNNYKSTSKTIKSIKKIDNEGFSQFFDEESSIAPSQYDSESQTPKELKSRGAFNYPRRDVMAPDISETGSITSNFFGQENSIVNLQAPERMAERQDSPNNLRNPSLQSHQDAEAESSSESVGSEESSSYKTVKSESSLIGKA